MAEPPRLPAILLPWDKSIIYFVTMCVKDRRQVLANQTVFNAMKETIGQLQKWHVLAGIVMPDHVHWVVSPVEDRELSVGNLQRKWIYVKDNPLRHGFVHRAEDWPYYLDFINELPDAGSCQLPLQEDRVQFWGVGG
jgi:hypothetical protein